MDNRLQTNSNSFPRIIPRPISPSIKLHRFGPIDFPLVQQQQLVVVSQCAADKIQPWKARPCPLSSSSYNSTQTIPIKGIHCKAAEGSLRGRKTSGISQCIYQGIAWQPRELVERQLPRFSSSILSRFAFVLPPSIISINCICICYQLFRLFDEKLPPVDQQSHEYTNELIIQL